MGTRGRHLRFGRQRRRAALRSAARDSGSDHKDDSEGRSQLDGGGRRRVLSSGLRLRHDGEESCSVGVGEAFDGHEALFRRVRRLLSHAPASVNVIGHDRARAMQGGDTFRLVLVGLLLSACTQAGSTQ